MTVTVTATTTPPGPHHWSRRRRRGVLGAAVLAIVLVLGVAGMLTVRHLDGRYGPIEPGMFSGPVNPDQLAASNGRTGRLLPGPSASVQMMSSLRNGGSHAVTVSSVDYPQFHAAVSGIRWSTWKPIPGGYVSGASTPWHSFPATIPSDWTIRLLISVHRPADCASYLRSASAAGTYDGTVKVRWKSLLGYHDTYLTGLTESVKVC